MDYYQDSYQGGDQYGSDPGGYQSGYQGGGGGGGDGGYRDRGPRGGGGDGYQRQSTPPLMTEKILADRKQFFLDLKENARGRVLKITEDVRGRRDTIMVPMEVLHEFHDAIGRILDYERGL
jgi:PurA ssDNA and RNA-binding protein